jgi:membrane-bound lytic murein transglycosylase D
MINSVVKNKVYDFAGEAVPMQDPEVFERLDRELSSNVYWQGNTLQILKVIRKIFSHYRAYLSRRTVSPMILNTWR